MAAFRTEAAIRFATRGGFGIPFKIKTNPSTDAWLAAPRGRYGDGRAAAMCFKEVEPVDFLRGTRLVGFSVGPSLWTQMPSIK